MAIGKLSLLLFWFRPSTIWAMLRTGPTLQSPLLLITTLTTVWGHSASEISRVDSFGTNWNRLTSERDFGRHVIDYSKSLTGYVLACSTHLTPISALLWIDRWLHCRFTLVYWPTYELYECSTASFVCYPRRSRSAIGVDIVLTLDVCMYVCLYVCMLAL